MIECFLRHVDDFVLNWASNVFRFLHRATRMSPSRFEPGISLVLDAANGVAICALLALDIIPTSDTTGLLMELTFLVFFGVAFQFDLVRYRTASSTYGAVEYKALLAKARHFKESQRAFRLAVVVAAVAVVVIEVLSLREKGFTFFAPSVFLGAVRTIVYPLFNAAEPPMPDEGDPVAQFRQNLA